MVTVSPSDAAETAVTVTVLGPQSVGVKVRDDPESTVSFPVSELDTAMVTSSHGLFSSSTLYVSVPPSTRKLLIQPIETADVPLTVIVLVSLTLAPSHGHVTFIV